MFILKFKALSTNLWASNCCSSLKEKVHLCSQDIVLTLIHSHFSEDLVKASSTNFWPSNCCSSLKERGTSNKSHFVQPLPFIFHMLSHIDFIHNTNLDFPSKIILTGLTILLVLIGRNNCSLYSLCPQIYMKYLYE